MGLPIAHGDQHASPFASVSGSNSASDSHRSVTFNLRDGHNPQLGPIGDHDGADPSDFPLPGRSSCPSSIPYSLTGTYRRPGFITGKSRPFVLPYDQNAGSNCLTESECEDLHQEQMRLLRDNRVIPPKHRRAFSESEDTIRPYAQPFPNSPRKMPPRDEEAAVATLEGSEPDETSALLPHGHSEALDGLVKIDTTKSWEEAVAAGQIKTTWRREAKTIASYSWPMMATFLLLYSLNIASVFAVGHIGKAELAAVSLGSMTANITGYAVFQGLATSLDTLCAQAYGSGRKHLVGLHVQRMVYFLWVCTIPIGIVWLCAEEILKKIVPEPEIARLAGLYLRILLIGAPGYAAFEAGKRFVQAQGLFRITLWILLFCAPLNAFLNWLFVWRLGFGFVGAPAAVAITETLLPICLFLYVAFIDGRQCWGGFSRRAFVNWGPMIRLAIPGLIMLLAEWLAFEILTLVSSYFSTAHLAAQSILVTLSTITYLLPLPISIAASTRIANLIGATLPEAAKVSAKVAVVVASFVGVFNLTLMSSLRNYIPQLFTNDPDVLEVVAKVLPLCAAFQVFDALATTCNGILRGLGRQEFGGYVGLICYYVIAMPISFGTGFGLHWELIGLWAGPAFGLGLVAAIEAVYIYRTSWDAAVDAARKRNTMT
ncbi:MAG: hypothetical protein M1837_007105 [Sclerophora amabilis]|nr:MAG: hypothetical protein M1837_007105 [Sclerophora amabilis]